MSALLAAMLAGAGAVPQARADEKPVADKVLVGAYYFPGWQQADRWYPIMTHPAARQPLIGFYREGDPLVAEAQIAQAAAYGVDFFAFDYYWTRGAVSLEGALDRGFLGARNLGRIKFCLLWCNHRELSAFTAEELDSFLRFAVERYLGHPRYLRIDGRPVVMFLDFSPFMRELGADKVRAVFDRAGELCKQRGLARPYFVACPDGFGGEGADVIARQLKSVGFEATAFYNYPFAGAKTRWGEPGGAPYADLLQTGSNLWDYWRNLTGLAHWPTVMAGWDPRPWHRDNAFVRSGRNPAAFRRMLQKAKPFASAGGVAMIEAWNEWGEGSILEPSKQDGFSYLEQVRTVFGGAPRPLPMPSPAAKVPVFPDALPMQSRWGFDLDAQGWTAIRDVADLRQERGALAGTTSGTDPSLMGPATFVQTSDYRTLHLRLRVTAPPGGPERTTVQFFWSGVEYNISEAHSAAAEAPSDGGFHDIALPLRDHPGWRGRLSQVRLDVGDRAGISFAIDLLELRP